MSAAAICGVGAAGLQVLAYSIYVRSFLGGRCRPSGISWLMWSYGTAVLLFMQADVGTPVSVMMTPAFCLACSAFIATRALAGGGRSFRPGRISRRLRSTR